MSCNKKLVDLLFWKDMISGDESAFSSIFKSYYQPLYNFGKLYASDKALINDSIQDLFMDFWEKRKNLKPEVDVEAYIYGAFRFKILRRINQKFLFTSFHEDHLNVIYEISKEDLEIRNEIDQERIVKINDLLNQLPPKQKEVIYLKFYKGLSNEQIAKILDINYQSVKNHVFRSLQVLREKSNKEDYNN
jgi:RNA polymerase sigma factor (sigma-70 family)